MRIRLHKKPVRNGSIVGLDLSLRASAACAIPFDWDHDLEKVMMMRAGGNLSKEDSTLDKYMRMGDIADAVLDFCREVQARVIGIEDHAYGAGGNKANETIEMTGVVKYTLFDSWGVTVEPVVASRARKVLLQKLPRSDVKKFTVKNVRRLGGPTVEWTDDEIDAFVVANYFLMVSGGTAMTFLGEM